MDDNSVIKLGNSLDLQISHDGSNSTILNQTGYLALNTDTAVIRSVAQENGIVYTANGAVDLYYDGVQRLATNANGIEVNGHVWLGDGEHVKFGSGTNGDLQIYHDGSHSRIHNSTGELIFRTGTNYTFYNSDASEKHAQFLHNGAVELYYDGGKKLETTSTGAILTSGAANTTAVRFGNTANRGLTISTYNNAGNNDSGVVLNAADSENSGYAATLEFDLGGVEFGRFDGNYDIFKLASACNGITFNGDYAAANRLND